MAPGENRTSTMDLETTSESSDKAENEPLTTQKNAEESTETGKSDVSVADEYADEPDETLSERLWGLTEMFPESVRDATSTITSKTTQGVKSFYSFSRSIVWVLVSSSVILFAPLIFEVERAQMEDMQRSQQKQVLLGPNTAISGGPGVPMPPMR